jgi:hypothetical protein
VQVSQRPRGRIPERAPLPEPIYDLQAERAAATARDMRDLQELTAALFAFERIF